MFLNFQQDLALEQGGPVFSRDNYRQFYDVVMILNSFPSQLLCSLHINPDKLLLIKNERNVEKGYPFTTTPIAECERQSLFEDKRKCYKKLEMYKLFANEILEHKQ